MLEFMTFMRSLEVKTLCQENINMDSNEFYMVFSGQCEIFKTKNEFKLYDEDGNEILEDQEPAIMNNSAIGF
jgi:hypothetical protein